MNKLVEKLKQFFNKLKKNRTNLLLENTSKIQENTKNNNFKKELIIEENEIIQLQKKYEKGDILEKELSPLEILNLIDLYKNQINCLNIEIANKKQI